MKIFALLAGAVLLPQCLLAAPLTEAVVNKIINEVAIVDPGKGPHKAALQEVVKGEVGVQTGVKSRSELLFADQTLTRIGPESYFSFQPGTRDMSLEKGTMLLQVPKGIGGATIRTAAVTAAITGTTIMIENVPGRDLKVLVLEGSLRLSRNGTVGDSLLLLPGKMVIMPPNAKRIPDPVSVDLARIMKTSSLVKMGKGSKPLPSEALIQNEIDTQTKSKAGNSLIATNLVILGGGTKVTIADNNVLAALDTKADLHDAIAASAPQVQSTPIPQATPIPPSVPLPTPPADPIATPIPLATPDANATPAPTPAATPDDSDDRNFQHTGHGDSKVSNSSDLKITKPMWVANAQVDAKKNLDVESWIAAFTVSLTAGNNMVISQAIFADSTHIVAQSLTLNSSLNTISTTIDLSKSLTLNAPLVTSAYGGGVFREPEDGRSLTLYLPSLKLTTLKGNIAPIVLDGGNAYDLSNFEGGNGGTLNIGDNSKPVTGTVDIETPISATTGKNGSTQDFGGKGGTVSVVGKDTVTVDSTIRVSDKSSNHASKSGGKITIDSRKTSGTAINITSSAQLLALLSAAAPGSGGSIQFISAGGAINMSGTATADHGTIDFHNNGAKGIVNLTNAILHGDVVKVGVLGADGTLNIGGGSIDGNSAISLYAAGSNGTVNFTDNVTLNGNSVKTISGATVTVRDGKVVTVNGPAPATVFTNHPNYTGSGGNNSTTGTFSGQGATTKPFNLAPPPGG